MLIANMKDDFNNLLEYREWVNHTMQHLSDKNKNHLAEFEKDYVDKIIRQDPNWYGEGVTYTELSNGITTYKNPALIEKLYHQVSDKISTRVRDRVKARKVQYNPFGLGVFIFDRASMGMFRLKEFYSPSLHRVVEQDEVRAIKKGHELVKDGSPVVERWEQKPDGKPKIRTTSKNVYAYFPPASKDKQAVDIFISCGGPSDKTAEEFLYSGISAIIVAQILEKARIQTRISVVIGTSPDKEHKTVAYAALVPVKNFDEMLDINLLALLTSDPRFYRHEGFKGVIALYDHFQAKCPGNYGYGFHKNALIKVMEESTYTQQAKLAPNRFYFGRTFSENDAIQEINATIEELANRLNIQ